MSDGTIVFNEEGYLHISEPVVRGTPPARRSRVLGGTAQGVTRMPVFINCHRTTSQGENAPGLRLPAAGVAIQADRDSSARTAVVLECWIKATHRVLSCLLVRAVYRRYSSEV